MDYAEYDMWDGHNPGASWSQIDRYLERSQHQQEERLTEELNRIAAQLDRREKIHVEIVDELEWKIDRYTAHLKHLYRSMTGKQDGTREQLKDRLTAFQHELREEHREHWQDQQTLERERREVLRELAELEDADLSELL